MLYKIDNPEFAADNQSKQVHLQINCRRMELLKLLSKKEDEISKIDDKSTLI